MELKKLGERLNLARRDFNLTQQEVANKLGIKREVLSYYENGTREIPLSILCKLSDLYGYTTSYFLDEIDEQKLKVRMNVIKLTDEDIEKIDFAITFVKNLYELTNLTKRDRKSSH